MRSEFWVSIPSSSVLYLSGFQRHNIQRSVRVRVTVRVRTSSEKLAAAMASREVRAEKVRRIFDRFDVNRDGGLDRAEMAALVIAVNPRVKFSDEQISAILDEVFRTYSDFILPHDRGLSFDGLLRTYDDGAGDVDRDFDALGLNLPSSPSPSELPQKEEVAALPPPRPKSSAAWAATPNHGVAFDSTWSLIDDLEILIKRLRSKQIKSSTDNNNNNNFDSYSDAGWSREIGGTDISDRRIHWDDSTPEYATFVRELTALRARADGARAREEAFDGHMAIGRGLYEHQLFRESLNSFKRACELQPTDVRPHFRAGNALYALGKYPEAKEEFLLALEAAEASGNQWAYLLPQIHVNLGISMEGEGMVLGACEHYREAAILYPSHFRALKLLGSALFGVGEYRAAEKALEEAIFLRADYADAHCDLGSVLHAMGEDDRAVQEFQKAIDLKPGHVDALYNLGGLFMDAGRYQRASEMYTRVLAVRPNHWRAQLNKAVALLGARESEEAKKALKEAFKMTKRVEVYDAIAHLKMLQKKKKKATKGGGGDGEEFVIVEASKFKRVGRKTTLRVDLANALEIRAFQRLTRLSRCDVDVLKKEMSETDVPISYSGNGIPEKSIRKAALEVILRRMLKFLKAETFQGAMKAINERVLSVLDVSGSGRVDLGMFFAILAPICSGPTDRRKRVAFDALLWRPNNEGGAQIRRSDALAYLKLLRAAYIPSHSTSDELHGETDNSVISYAEFLEMFNDPDWGFGILATLAKLEAGDRVRHGRHTCSICRYPIIGSRFKETKNSFSLCNRCYSEGKVPSVFKQEEYKFIEYGTESEALKDKCSCFNLHSKSLENDP
ncbi:putative EF-hand domain, tetratricopeptide-like helical domain superfamily, EF-hand domain pair [Dioscorea sansibarensis]